MQWSVSIETTSFFILNHSTVVTNIYRLTLAHSIFTDDGSQRHCVNFCFAENIGLRLNSPGRNFNKNYFFVADNVVHIKFSPLPLQL